MDEKAIFNNARKISDSAVRDEYLSAACGDDLQALNRLQELLAADDSDSSFLEKPPAGLGVTESLKDEKSPIGERIGPYKLLQEIGEGGMGSVFMAEQTEPVMRRVALKIIKAGMDSKQVIARFEAERQALAMMDHPNIARLLDVGTTESGRPYFVMELVKGVPITEYCDDKRLSVKQRLELFTSVCNAVQHAHQKGIIHRDLKPSNILVAEYDDKVVPKIIDFGLAKALHQSLTDMTMFTQLGQVVGTLAYMSPEQSKMNQLDVDTRTDIYSLGVLLYALLTGTTPFDQKRLQSAALDELLRIIQQEEPPRPSTRVSRSNELKSVAANRKCDPQRLGSIVRGDLDWIVMKALEKDRSRRYQTANGLSADVLRYLAGEPTVAAPPTVWYRTQKFVNRYRIGVAVGASLLLMMLIGIIGTATGLAWALDEKELADEARKQADRSAEVARIAKDEAVRNAEKAESARSDAEYEKYNANLQALFSLLDRQSRTLAKSLLRTAPADYRNWEWAYQAFRVWPKNPDDAYEAVREAAAAPKSLDVKSFWQQEYLRVAQDFVAPDIASGMFTGQFSSDGKFVFLGRYDGGIHMFSTSNGKLIRDLPQAHGGLLGISLSPDGKELASFVFSGGAFIWDVATGKIVRHHPFDLELNSSWTSAWSNDQKYIISAHMGGDLRIWNSETLEELESSPLAGHQGDVRYLFVPPAGNEVWSASLDGSIRKWSLPDGQEIAVKTFLDKDDIIQDADFHCIDRLGEKALLFGGDGVSIVWDIESQDVIARLRTPFNEVGDMRHAASFSPDGSCVVVVSGEQAAIFDIESAEQIAEIPGQGLQAVHFGPEGKDILTIDKDARARLWTCSNRPANRLARAHDDAIYQVDMDEDGDLLLTGSYDMTATIWDTNTWEKRLTYREHEAQILAVDLSPDQTRAATLDATGTLDIWDAQTGLSIKRIEPQSGQFAGYVRRSGGGLRANILHFPAVLSTGLFTPDGSRVVAFQADSMKVFDAQSGEQLVALQGADKSGWPIYSFDSSRVAVLEMNSRSIRIWDLETGECLHTLDGHRKGLVMAQFNPCDHRLATGSMDLSVRIWDSVTGNQLHVLEDNSAHPASCRFSADGRWLIGGYTDCIVRLWDPSSGELVRRFLGHNNRLRDCRLNPDGTRLLSWAVDDQAIVWDATGPNNNPLVLLEGNSRLIQAHWTPDGRDILSFWSDGGIQIWQGATRADLEVFRSNQDFTSDQLSEFRNLLQHKK